METDRTYEGTHEIHTLIVGADITGIPALHGRRGCKTHRPSGGLADDHDEAPIDRR
jgi:hypothetical protein